MGVFIGLKGLMESGAQQDPLLLYRFLRFSCFCVTEKYLLYSGLCYHVHLKK